MYPLKLNTRLMLIWLLSGLAAAASPSLADSVKPPEIGLLPWQSLSFEARQALTEVSIRIGLQPQTDQQIAASLLPPPPGHESVSTRQPILSIEAQINASLPFQNKRWTGTSWFRADDAQVLQRFRYKPGRDGSEKRYRFTTDGVFRERAEPDGRQEAKQPANRWSKLKRAFYPFGNSKAACAEISDPLVLLYIVTAREIALGEERQLCVFNKKAIYNVRLKALEMQPSEANYTLNQAGSETPVKRKIDALVLQIDASPMDVGARDLEPFEFIGLEGKIQFLIDPDTRIPLQITGRLEGFGEVVFRLTRVEPPTHDHQTDMHHN